MTRLRTLGVINENNKILGTEGQTDRPTNLKIPPNKHRLAHIFAKVKQNIKIHVSEKDSSHKFENTTNYPHFTDFHTFLLK